MEKLVLKTIYIFHKAIFNEYINKICFLKGIGYDKDSYIKDLHEHQDKFNDFLQQLSKHYNQEETVEKSESNKEELDLNGQSLELKSKQSRARLQ